MSERRSTTREMQSSGTGPDDEREEQLDAALGRMRAAFADVPEEQLVQDVVEIVGRDRQERRAGTSAPTPG
jgi:DNA-binding IscR family transcriptional regulator